MRSLSLVRRIVVIVAPLAVAALLPIWTAWYIGSWEATGERATLWSVAESIPRNITDVGLRSTIIDYQSENLFQCAVCISLGVGINLLIRRVGIHTQGRRGFAPVFPDETATRE